MYLINIERSKGWRSNWVRWANVSHFQLDEELLLSHIRHTNHKLLKPIITSQLIAVVSLHFLNGKRLMHERGNVGFAYNWGNGNPMPYMRQRKAHAWKGHWGFYAGPKRWEIDSSYRQQSQPAQLAVAWSLHWYDSGRRRAWLTHVGYFDLDATFLPGKDPRAAISVVQ